MDLRRTEQIPERTIADGIEQQALNTQHILIACVEDLDVTLLERTEVNSRFALYSLRRKFEVGGEKDYGHDDLRIGRSTPGERR